MPRKMFVGEAGVVVGAIVVVGDVTAGGVTAEVGVAAGVGEVWAFMVSMVDTVAITDVAAIGATDIATVIAAGSPPAPVQI